MKEHNMINDMIFSIHTNLGNRSDDPSEITFGGYDERKMAKG